MRLCPEFNMHRMVMQYAGEYYLATHRRHLRLQADNASRARNLASWRARVEAAWPRLEIKSVSSNLPEVALGNELQISALVFLDSLTPEDVSVQILSGRVTASSEIKEPAITSMTTHENEGNSCYRFHASLPTSKSGFFGFAIRLLPNHSDAVTPFIPLLITWAQPTAINAPDLVLK
jgi:glycogen phosphorylase